MKQELVDILAKYRLKTLEINLIDELDNLTKNQADQILDLILDKIEDCKPLYLEGESKDFTEGQEWTIRQIKNKLRS